MADIEASLKKASEVAREMDALVPASEQKNSTPATREKIVKMSAEVSAPCNVENIFRSLIRIPTAV